MLPIFRLDLFSGVLSILRRIFGVSYGVSLAMNSGELLRHFVNFPSGFSST